jgi:hypothetical protein
LPRTNISIDAGVASAISDEATKENKTLYAFANESLREVLNVCKEGGSPNEIFSAWRFTRILRDVESIPIPGDLVEKCIKRLYEVDKEWILKLWFEEGLKLGTYLRMYFPKLDDLAHEAEEFRDLLPVRRVEVQESEAFVEEEERGENARAGGKLKSVVIRAVGAGLSIESTKCSEQLIRGIVSAYSLSIVSSNISEGIIELKAEQKMDGGKQNTRSGLS